MIQENSETSQSDRRPTLADGWESELSTERAKVSVRWLAIALLWCAMLWIRHAPGVMVTLADTGYIAIAALTMTGLEALYLWRPGREQIPRWFKYLTVLGDMIFISFLIHYTGNTQSPFFFVYFVFLISNCLRYGLLMSLYVAAMVNVLYVMTLGFAPPDSVRASVLGGEGLKIIAFWAVAFYGGSVSSRLRRQANLLRVYEETLLEMRVQLKSLQSQEQRINSAEAEK